MKQELLWAFSMDFFAASAQKVPYVVKTTVEKFLLVLQMSVVLQPHTLDSFGDPLNRG